MSMSLRQLLSKSCDQPYQIETPVQNGDKLYLDKKTSDVFFVFESDDPEQSSAAPTRIGAHRILLANNSNKFKEIFYGDEELIECDREIPVTDVSQAAFKEFLKFFYLNEVELHAENIVGLMYLAHKYKAVHCIDVCVQFLKDIATVDNILIALGLAIEYNHADMLKFCEQFLAVNTDEVIESNGFLECDRQTLAYMINANLLACSEVKLFESCMEWVKAKSKSNVLTKENVDEHFGDLFYEIRFGSMTIQELCNLAMKYDAVLSHDFKTITKLIVMPNFQSEKFNTRPRQIKWHEETGMTKYNEIEEIRDNQLETMYNSDAMDKQNFKRKNPTILLTNKRLRLISSAGNDMDPDSLSSDDEMECQHVGNETAMKIGSRRDKN